MAREAVVRTPYGHAMSGIKDRITGLPLRWQIGSLVVLGLLTIFVLFDLLGRSIAEDAKQRTVNGWANIATSTASVIDSELGLQYQRLEAAAVALGDSAGDPSSQSARLTQTMTGAQGTLGRAVLLAPDRSIVWPGPGAAATTVVADPRVLDPIQTGGRYASGVIAVDGRAQVIIAVPVSSGGRPTAVLALLFSPADGVIGDLVSSARGLAHTGHAELVDQQDRVIASTEQADQLGPGEHPDFYDPHLAHRTSGVGLTQPVGPNDPIDQGQRHDMAFVSLRTVPWGFALGGSDAEISADAARWEGQTIVLGALSLLVALLLVWITTRSVARPVLALAAASRQIASGDLTTPVPVGGEGEVRQLAQAFDHMRDKLRTALSDLAVEKSRYEGIVTSMADAVVTTDRDRRITAFNPAAAALTGWTTADALGQPCCEVMSPQGDAGHDHEEGTTRVTLRRRDGRDVSVSVTRSAITDRDGRSAGMVHVLRDISAEAEVERMKEEFLATVSHELRTPLGFIMGYATSLLLPDAPDDRATTRRFLGVIAESSKELEQLVDDLLDMTKIGSGTLSVTPRPTRLGALVRAAVDRARVRGPEHRIRSSVPASLPPLLADPRRIEQVLYDLLDNAIKYSPDGGTITVSAARTGESATVSVIDQGLGIPPDECASIFERFHRGRLARARGITGTGLGLAICKGIIEAHGGRIWAESPPLDAAPGTRGSAIRFTIPLATDAAIRLAAAAEPTVGAAS
jgi:two-component system, OmpR family, phosphate regulon sensor histidine kinase PhoR